MMFLNSVLNNIDISLETILINEDLAEEYNE
jgi:hypothetical protein